MHQNARHQIILKPVDNIALFTIRLLGYMHECIKCISYDIYTMQSTFITICKECIDFKRGIAPYELLFQTAYVTTHI